MERVREDARPAKVVPRWRRPQWKAAAGLAACAVICVGLYYGADRLGLGASGNVAAVPDLAQWSEESAGSGEAPVAGADVYKRQAVVRGQGEQFHLGPQGVGDGVQLLIGGQDGDDLVPVSYTHLDVYKRQVHGGVHRFGCGDRGAGL